MTGLLDASDQRTILLHAPAGYGKTTLSRQWVKTLSGAIWLSLTPTHLDVAAFAHDVAELVGPDEVSFIDEYLRARTNPQRAAREVATALAAKVEAAHILWITLDDYQEVAESPETEEMVEILQEQTTARFLISSRLRPRWAKARLELYGDVLELDREALTMDADGVGGARRAARRPGGGCLSRSGAGLAGAPGTGGRADRAAPAVEPHRTPSPPSCTAISPRRSTGR